MNNFVIEDGILKAYFGHDKVVVVPDGVKKVGGDTSNEPKDYPRELCGDPIGYKAFYNNKVVEEIYLPDSVETIGFKSMERCENLKVLSFSNRVKAFECNSILDCKNLKTIIYRGTMEEFKALNIDFDYFMIKLDTVYCIDGIIKY